MDDVDRRWVEEVTGRAVDGIEPLVGGVASRLWKVRLGSHMLVLWQPNPDKEQDRPGIVGEAASALLLARAVLGDLVPELVAVRTPDGAGEPAVLMSWLPGAPVIGEVDTQRLATPLARLHAASVPDGLPAFAPWCTDNIDAVPPWTKAAEAWRDVAEIARRPRPAADDVFLHRDYHPGNVLWADGEVTGIVDWPFACTGPRGVDVAHCRANLAFIAGVDRADAFLRDYTALARSYVHDVYWDALDVLSLATDAMSGVMAFNAFGAGLDLDVVRANADEYAAALAERVRLQPRPR